MPASNNHLLSIGLIALYLVYHDMSYLASSFYCTLKGFLLFLLQFTGHPGAEHKGLLPERIRFSPPAFAAKITK